ncbi:response regulator [Ruminococcaceae bacterium OttesenSCG-928-D13]|nr:response regulator [Ruminococcaceae bacterium OttesenSCG-928-D13]
MKKFQKDNGVVLLFLAAALMVLVVSFISNSMISSNNNVMEDSVRQRMLTVAKSAATVVDAAELEAFRQPEDMEKPEYAGLRARLQEFAEYYDVVYVYYLRPYGDNQLQFVVDNDPDPETQVSLYDIVDMEPVPGQALAGTAATVDVGDYSIDWEGLLSAYAPVYDDNGQVYCIAGVDISDEIIVNVHDTTSTLMWSQLLSLLVALGSGLWAMALYRRKARQSEAANVAKSDFLSRMSHEIRTPMNAIIGLCRMAKESDDQKQVQAYLGNIQASSDHLLSLINDILDLSKIESGKAECELVMVDCRQEAEAVRSIITPQAEAKGQVLEVAIDPQVPGYVNCDITRLNQVLVNLLGNAVKFTPEGGTVALEVQLLESRPEGCRLLWSVRDTGIGIEEKQIARLFDPFEQGDNSTTRKYGGTGLGLAISRQLVEMMGGAITVKSQVGAGSTFSFSLWLTTGTGAEFQAAAGPDDTKVDLTGRRILLVEDSDINRLIAEDIFTGMGAEVEIACDGRQAVNRHAENPDGYDMIFMDIQMPVMDGYAATRAIRASGLPGAADIPIIAMTANVFREDVQRALDAGMNGHVGKPFEVAQIEAAILQAMRTQAVKS